MVEALDNSKGGLLIDSDAEVIVDESLCNDFDCCSPLCDVGLVFAHAAPLCDKYYLEKDVLGTGGFSVIRLAVSISTKSLVVVKLLSFAAVQKYEKLGSRHCSLLSEVEILHGLVHPNIVKLLDVVKDESSIAIVFEYLNVGDLLCFIQIATFLPEACALRLFHPCLRGVAYLHSSFICHRDIKPENFMLVTLPTNMRSIKLVDFGLSVRLRASRSAVPKARTSDGSFACPEPLMRCVTWCGSMYYMAPEIIKTRQGCGDYSFLVDVYALGVMLYVMTCGLFPFEESSPSEKRSSSADFFAQVLVGEWSFDPNHYTYSSDALRHLVTSMMQIAEDNRLCAEFLLRDPWLSTFELDWWQPFHAHSLVSTSSSTASESGSALDIASTCKLAFEADF